MESTSEVVWKEQTKSSVSKKSVQEVSSTSVQKLSSSSTLIGEQDVLSMLGSDGVAIGDKVISDGGGMSPSSASENLILSSPLITSPSPLPEEGNALNTSTLQSEFSAMKLKDDHGNEIGEMVQQKQKQESVQVSSAVLTTDNGSKTTSSSSSVAQVSSSVVQQSATIKATSEESSSSSVSCSSFSSTKKQEIVSSSTRSLSSIKSSQSIEKVVKSSTAAIVEDHEF